MPKNSSAVAVADPVVDVEEGTAALKEDEIAIVEPRKAKLIGILMYALLGVYVLLFAGLMVYSVKESKNWGQVLRDFLIVSRFMLWNFCLIPQLKKYAIKAFAKKPSTGSRSDDLDTKLLVSEK